MSGGKWLSCGPRYKKDTHTHAQKEMNDFFHKAALEKQLFDQQVNEARYELQKSNADRRAHDKRELDEEYRNYIPPII